MRLRSEERREEIIEGSLRRERLSLSGELCSLIAERLDLIRSRGEEITEERLSGEGVSLSEEISSLSEEVLRVHVVSSLVRGEERRRVINQSL